MRRFRYPFAAKIFLVASLASAQDFDLRQIQGAWVDQNGEVLSINGAEFSHSKFGSGTIQLSDENGSFIKLSFREFSCWYFVSPVQNGINLNLRKINPESAPCPKGQLVAAGGSVKPKPLGTLPPPRKADDSGVGAGTTKIEIGSINFYEATASDGTLNGKIDFRIRSKNTQFSVVVPFSNAKSLGDAISDCEASLKQILLAAPAVDAAQRSLLH